MYCVDYYYYYDYEDTDDKDKKSESGGSVQYSNPPHGTTMCQRQQLEATLKNQTGLVLYIPQCTPTGQYVPLQVSVMKEDLLVQVELCYE